MVGDDSKGLSLVTWGAVKRMTWECWTAYCDEAYAILSPDWLTSAQKSPAGIDIVTLRQDLNQITR